MRALVLPSINGDQTLSFSDKKKSSWSQLLTHAHQNSQQLVQQRKYIELKNTIQTYQGLLKVFACILAGKVPCLNIQGSKQELEGLDFPEFASEPSPTRTANTASVQKLCEQMFQSLDKPAMVFCTSGTTNDAKKIVKTWRQLLTEVKDLQNFYQLQAGHHIVCLVQPFHIYGFIHCVLLSLLTDCSCSFQASPIGLYHNQTSKSAIDLLISSPVVWPICKKILLESKVRNCVSSGAEISPQIHHEICNLIDRADHFWDIIGSTETGGIAYKALSNHSENLEFKCFPGVKLHHGAYGINLRSPYLADDRHFPLSDHLKLNKDGSKFIYKGRKDRIIKYGGKRFDLSSIESALKSCAKDHNFFCSFKTNHAKLKGGTLQATVSRSSENIDIRRLRELYLKSYQLPFPEQFIFEDNKWTEV